MSLPGHPNGESPREEGETLLRSPTSRIDAGVLPPSHRDHASDQAPLLAVRGLTRLFRDHAAERGIRGVDLTLRAGEFVALLGPSGAGKTTALRLLAGLDAADAGSVQRPGRTADDGRCRRGDTAVALVFQKPRLIGRLTALDNVLAGRLGHLPRWRGLLRRFRPDDLRHALQALERVGLLARADERCDRLSGGEQQRVAIARALAQAPSVLLADEPVASLDPGNAERVLRILRELADDGLAVLCSLHQPELAQRYADRLVLLDRGRLIGTHAAAAVDRRQLERLYGGAVPAVG
jgi:phosphonate transport system ATP-binding protein